MAHSFLAGARAFDDLADQSPSGPEVVQALRNLARIWREIAEVVGEVADPDELCYDQGRGVEQSGSSTGS